MNNVNVLIKGCNCIAVFNILNDKNLIFNHLFITIYLNANQQLGHQQPVHQQPVQQQQQRQVLEENFNPPDKREEILEKSENDGFMSEFAQDGFFDTQKLHVEEKQRIKKDLLKKEPEENTF